MTEYRLKTPKSVEKTIVSAYKKIEDGVVGTYKKVEDSVVSGYKKIEDKFVDAFLEKVEQPDSSVQDDSSDGPKQT